MAIASTFYSVSTLGLCGVQVFIGEIDHLVYCGRVCKLVGFYGSYHYALGYLDVLITIDGYLFFLYQLEDLMGSVCRSITSRIDEYYEKFFTAVATYDIRASEILGKQSGKLLKDRSTCLMPVGIIDLLEKIDVNEKTAYIEVVSTASGELLFKPFDMRTGGCTIPSNCP